MEARLHILVLGVLAVYTVVLVLLVNRSIQSLRSHHACSDVSSPLSKLIASLLDSVPTPSLFNAIGGAKFSAMRILIFDPEDAVLFDSTEPQETKARPPNESQRDVLATHASGKPTRLVHRTAGSKMVHVTGTKCKSGTVVTEA